MIQIPLYHFTISFISVSLHLPSFSEVNGCPHPRRPQSPSKRRSSAQRFGNWTPPVWGLPRCTPPAVKKGGRFWCFTSHSWGKSHVFEGWYTSLNHQYTSLYIYISIFRPNVHGASPIFSRERLSKYGLVAHQKSPWFSGHLQLFKVHQRWSWLSKCDASISMFYSKIQKNVLLKSKNWNLTSSQSYHPLPILSSLTYLIHVHLFIYHLHPQCSSPGHSHQAGHLWRGISHSQRAMADEGFGMWFLWFLSWNMCFLGFWDDRSQRTTLMNNFLWDTGRIESTMRNVASKEPWLSQKNGFSIHTIIVESCWANTTSTADVLVDATRLDMSWRCELSIISTVCFQEVCNSHFKRCNEMVLECWTSSLPVKLQIASQLAIRTLHNGLSKNSN